MIDELHKDRTLELSGNDLSQLVEQVLARLTAFLDSLPDQPAVNVEDAASVARSVSEPLPATGDSLDAVLSTIFDRYLPVSFNPASPGYMAYVPGGGLPVSAVADLISGITNRYVGVWQAAPAMAQVEATVIRWFCEMVGYPSGAGGFLTSGGSLANWSALVTARRCRLPDNFLNGVIYTSDQAHHSVNKAAMLAGFPAANVAAVAVDENYRVRVDQLVDRIRADRVAGRQPFCVVANAGTVNTGAVDDLAALADVAASEDLWLHVDAAYGGFFALTDRGRAALRGIDRADSVTIDPHKSLFLPFGTGGLLVRDRDTLKQAHDVRGDYMPELPDDEFSDFSQLSPEMSRPFRGLRIWLPMKLHGAEPFRRNLDEKLDLARWMAGQLRAFGDDIEEEVEVIQPQLSLFAFRLKRPGYNEDQLRQLNEELRERIVATKRVLLSPTIVDGRYVIRVCILSFRTHRETCEVCLCEIRRAIGELCA